MLSRRKILKAKIPVLLYLIRLQYLSCLIFIEATFLQSFPYRFYSISVCIFSCEDVINSKSMTIHFITQFQIFNTTLVNLRQSRRDKDRGKKWFYE